MRALTAPLTPALPSSAARHVPAKAAVRAPSSDRAKPAQGFAGSLGSSSALHAGQRPRPAFPVLSGGMNQIARPAEIREGRGCTSGTNEFCKTRNTDGFVQFLLSLSEKTDSPGAGGPFPVPVQHPPSHERLYAAFSICFVLSFDLFISAEGV